VGPSLVIAKVSRSPRVGLLARDPFPSPSPMPAHRVGSEGRYNVTHSGGTAPASHRLPCYARVGTRGSYSIVKTVSGSAAPRSEDRTSRRSYGSDAVSVKPALGGDQLHGGAERQRRTLIMAPLESAGAGRRRDPVPEMLSQPRPPGPGTALGTPIPTLSAPPCR